MAVVIDRPGGTPSTVEFADMDDEHLRHWAAIRIEALEIMLRRQLDLNTGLRFNKNHDSKTGKFAKGVGVGHVPKPGALKTSTRRSDLSDKGKAAVDANNERYGVTQNGLEAELESELTPQSIKDGKAWYPETRQFNEDLASRSGLSLEQVTAITALVSPRVGWPRNKVLAERVAMGYKRFDDIEDPVAAAKKLGGALSVNLGAAIAVARGGDIDKHMTGAKRRSFYNNMLRPNETDDVTVDTHMQRAAMRSASQEMSLDDALDYLGANRTSTGGSGAGYVAIAEAVRAVATRRGLSPAEVQSAYWISVAGSSDGGWADHPGRRRVTA